MSGYALIYRSLLDHPAFRNDAEAMAFGWMIVRAAWRDVDVRYKGHRLPLKRGQLAISQRDMAIALDRDKGWIERLWKRLRAEAMIEADVKAGVAVVTICNYDQYQTNQSIGEASTKAEETGDKGQTQGSSKAQNNTGNTSNNNSVANATGGEPPDPVKQIWDLGVGLLTASGQTEKEARSLIGMWRKKGDGKVLEAFLECQAQSISSPLEWLQKRLATARYVSASGYEYRGSDQDVLREAERRGDNNTYWAVKAAMARPENPRKSERRRGAASIGSITTQIAAGGQP